MYFDTEKKEKQKYDKDFEGEIKVKKVKDHPLSLKKTSTWNKKF